MKDVLFRLQHVESGRLTIDRLPPHLIELIDNELPSDGTRKTIVSGNPARILRASNGTYVVLAFSDDSDRIRSNRLLKTEAEVMLAAAKNADYEIEKAREKAELQTKRLIHNLKSLTAKIAQEIYYIVLQDKLMESPKETLSYFERQIADNPRETAKAFLAILKYQTAQKTEFSAFHKLNGDIRTINREAHKIHKVLMNVFYLFFGDFTDKHVKVDIQHSEIQGLFDYDSIHVAIYHIVENAAKYIKHRGDFSVQIVKSANSVDIIFDMESLLIKDEEVGKILTENYSGELARRLELQGSGIGLYLAKQMAIINEGGLVVLNGRPLPGSPEYARNKFTLSVPRAD